MSLVALDGTPLVIVGAPTREGGVLLGALNTVGTMAAVNAAAMFYGQIYTEDGGSHTIDTTGSSSLGWRAGAVTFANAGTTLKVGLATLDTTNGPPGRATNSAGTITLSVSKSLTGGGGGVTANAWQEHVPDAGSLTVANGDFIAFAIQMTARGGADSVINQATATNNSASQQPVLAGATTFDGTATYAAVARIANAVITFSDGVRGYFWGGSIMAAAATTQTWNNTSGTKEYGNFFQMPVPAKIYGLVASCSVGGDTDFILYSDPLGTPAAQKTTSVDANAIGGASVSGWLPLLFASPYSTTASQPVAAIIKPTTATNISAPYKTFNISGHQKSETLGTNGYAVNRNTGAFAAQNSNKDRFAIGLLVGAFDAGGGGGISRARAFAGAG